jgi:hypothetical protein
VRRADAEEHLMERRPTVRWLVRLTPLAGGTVDDLLKMPLSLDVWEREASALVAAMSEPTIGEIERRRVAKVERLRTTAGLESADHGPAKDTRQDGSLPK